MIKAVVLDPVALNRIDVNGAFKESWLEDFHTNYHDTRISSRVVDGIVYLLSDTASTRDRLGVIAAGAGGFLSEIPEYCRVEAMARAIRAILSVIEPTVEIPTSWRKYNRGSVLTFQSNSLRSNCRARFMLERSPRGTRHVYLFAIDTDERDASSVPRNWQVFDAAVSNYPTALDVQATLQQTDSPDTASDHLELVTTPSQDIVGGYSLEQWYETKLTLPQRKFVDSEWNRPIRLRGSAGTGKTLALIIKCLRGLHSAATRSEGFRVGFLTHSMSTVEIVRNMMLELDRTGSIYSPQPEIHLRVTTLQELANSAMAYDLHDLQPLSDDGLEGKKMQFELLESILEDFRRGDWKAYRRLCSEPFCRYLEEDKNSRARKFFCWELMNEFACVLDAQGVRGIEERQRKYLRMERRKWMMKLLTETEREVVLVLYAKFRQQLREMETIGVDQMIADYLGYLDSFMWERIRSKQGFDALFVDELHLFNRNERMVFQSLMRSESSPPVVFMAYDAKQSPRDTFVGFESEKYDYWRDAGLGNVEMIELRDVFRYTPEVARLLSYIDSTFPGVDLDEEWPAYSGVSRIESGPTPICCTFRSVVEQYNRVFARAHRWARRLERGNKVAVLCLNEENFETYLNAGEHKRKFVAVTSREELGKLRYAGKRFILSRPEYVAGLQFDTVLLVDVNEHGVSEEDLGIGARRRFISELYLGASRAERGLEVYAITQLGGLAEVLAHAIEEGGITVLHERNLHSLN